MASSDTTAGVALLAMGGPRTAAEVQPFLESLFVDPMMIRLPYAVRPFQAALARWVARRRAPGVTAKYATIGFSPLVPTTEALARALADAGRVRGLRLHAWAAMRYGPPRADRVLREGLPALVKERPDAPVVLLPQYPFYSGATSASSLGEAERVVEDARLRPVRVERFGAHPLYLRLVEDQVRAGLDRIDSASERAHLLFTAHGLPKSYVRRGDPYEDEVRNAFGTLRSRLRDRLDPDRIHLAFQSRVGPTRWLQPYTDRKIAALGDAGVESLVVVPFGFTCEHLETLEEIDILYGALARQHGVREFVRVPAPGLDPRYVALLVTLVEEALADDGAS